MVCRTNALSALPTGGHIVTCVDIRWKTTADRSSAGKLHSIKFSRVTC